MTQDIVKNIKKVRKKLNMSIKKNGINSEETREISEEINQLINEYYKSIKQIEYPSKSKMKENYKKSYNGLKKITKKMSKFPTVEIWNRYAKENNYLSNISIEYISELKWNYLRAKVMKELNMEI